MSKGVINKEGVLNDTHRRERYMESIQQILNLAENDSSIKPIVVENNGLRPTYLDSLKCDVVYTNNNNTRCGHKGVNELLDINEIIHRYNIQDEDMIIKLTGRYKLLNPKFIELVKNGNYDAYVKFFNVCTKQYMYDDCVLGLFALRCKYVKGFKYEFGKSAECEFAGYVRTHIDKDKLMEVDQLELECCFADDLRILIV